MLVLSRVLPFYVRQHTRLSIFSSPKQTLVPNKSIITQSISATGFTESLLGLLANLSIDTQLAGIGLALTLVQFYLADRHVKTERVTKFEDAIGDHMAKLETLASQMRKMRQEVTSLEMMSNEFVAVHQKIQAESEATLTESRNVLRRLGSVTVLPELFYGPAFWNLTRSIERDAILTKWRLSTLVACNQLIIAHKMKPSLHPVNEFLISTPPVPQNNRIIRRLLDDLQALTSGDVSRIKLALDEDILDTQLAILTNNDLNAALKLIMNKMSPTAQLNFSAGLEPFDPPILNRIASFCLRAAARNLPFNTSFLAIMQQFYQQTTIATDFLKTMSSAEGSNLIKWHAAAKLMCHISRNSTLPGVKTPSAVPAGLLGIISLREAQISAPGSIRQDLLQQSIDFFEEAITIGPFRAYYRIHRAHAEYLRSNIELGSEDIEQALKEDPDNAYGHMMKALFLLEKNKLEEAKQEASWHTRVPQTNPVLLTFVYEILAKLHKAMGDLIESEKYSCLARETGLAKGDVISNFSSVTFFGNQETNNPNQSRYPENQNNSISPTN